MTTTRSSVNAISSLLKGQAGFEVVGTAASGREAIKLAAELKPNTIITEIVMPELNGIDAAVQILAQFPEIHVIALTARSARTHGFETPLKAHFSGYVLKKCSFNQLVDAIRAVQSGQMYLCPEVVGAVVSSHVHNPGGGKPVHTNGTNAFSKVSGREREVLQLVAEGHSTKEIADRLSISLKTVETHRRRVMAKLKLFSIAELTKYAIREGLTTV